jgi:hypothetical protein
MPSPRFYDSEVNVRDEAWAREFFGVQDVHRPGLYPLFELTELHYAAGEDKVLEIKVLDQNGHPMGDIPVAIGPHDVKGDVVRATTGVDGRAQIQLDDAHLYYVPGQGHYACAVLQDHSDVYNSVGWVGGQDRWLNPVFVYQREQPEPPPEPDPPEPLLPDKLDRIIELLERIVEWIESPESAGSV